MEDRWYGWQPVLVDLASVATALAGTAAGGQTQEGATIVAASVFTLGSPIIHLAHGHARRAAGSLALRLLLPAIGAASGAATGLLLFPSNNGSRGDVGEIGGFLGGLVGGVSGIVCAAVVDDVMLAEDKVLREPLPPPDAHPTLEPRVGVVSGGMTLGLGGAF
jgi:hypothetical protein